MKKSFYFLASAALLFASCSSDDYVGNTLPNGSDVQNPIAFVSTTPNMTRATTLEDAAAATKLGNTFVVYGEKNMGSGYANVFNEYQVKWADKTANSTASNTNDWEYVGLTAYAQDGSEKVTQTIKYWDTNATDYVFTAFSVPTTNGISFPKADADLVSVEKNTTATDEYAKGYTITMKAGSDWENVYFADRIKVEKGTGYTFQPVTFNFRSFTSKVRVGFYEVVPGYTVKINNIIPVVAGTVGTANTSFDAGVYYPQIPASGEGTVAYTVAYNDATVTGLKNRAKVTLNENSNAATNLVLGSNITTIGKISSTAATPTLDKTGTETYTQVLPNPAQTGNMTFKVNYTLESEDGSETITLTSDVVTVPAQYLQWTPNYAYTYIFKISEESGDLNPITFDAYITTDETTEQETTTTVKDNAITTYAKSKVAGTEDYSAGAIYVVEDGVTTMSVADAKTVTGMNVYTVALTENSNAVLADLTEEAVVNALTKNDYSKFTLTAIDPVPTTTSTVPVGDSTLTFGENQVLTFSATANTYVYVHCTTTPAEGTSGVWNVKVIQVK